MKTTVRVLCALSTFSLVMYAFTGLTLWSAIQSGDLARVMFLMIAHAAPFVALIAVESA